MIYSFHGPIEITSMNDQAIESLLLRLRDENEAVRKAARDDLLAGYLQRLQELATRLMRPDDRVRRYEQSSDLVQKTAIDLLRALAQHPPASAREFRAWVGRIIMNNLKDFARHYYGPQGSGTLHDTDPAHRNPDAEAFARDSDVETDDPGERELLARMADLVEKMPEELRIPFTMRCIDQLTYPEIGKVLDMTVNHATYLCMRAMAWLRERMDPPKDPPDDEIGAGN